MKIYNSLTRQKEDLTPLESGHFKIYVCGPTVYDFFHIGNARPFIVYDTLRRYLLWLGNQVTYVQNFTDIDDKVIVRANKEGITSKELAETMIGEYFHDADALNILRASIHPRATESIDDIIRIVKILVDKGHAYVTDDGVYFSIDTFPSYGKLSGHNLDDLIAGASERVSDTESKRNPLDFAVWKFKKEGEPFWPSPWGDGRPGWHIECSAMSLANLGETIDIHAGGVDLTFPHHENEIAQSEAATGKHILRFFILQAHYRMPINFSDELLDATVTSWKRITSSADHLAFVAKTAPDETTKSEEEQALQDALTTCRYNWKNAMDDDLNTADAIAALFELVRAANTAASSGDVSAPSLLEARDTLIELFGVLGLDPSDTQEEAVPSEIMALVEERTKAKEARDYSRADAIRDEVLAKGFRIEDTPQGVRVLPL